MNVWPSLIARARAAAGLSQVELARRAGTSRTTLSAYEHGRKAPSADTLGRLVSAAGWRLEIVPVVSWREELVGRGHAYWVPDALWRAPSGGAFADIVLPITLNWSAPGRRFDVRDRRQRARLYEVLLREGEPADLERWVDGFLLVDVWPELVLPAALRRLWEPVVDAELGSGLVEAGARVINGLGAAS